MKIYDEFTSKIKSCSRVNTLSKFVEKLCAKMGCTGIHGNKDERKKVLFVIKQNNVYILSLLRKETQFVVLLMRELIEEKKEKNGVKGFQTESEIKEICSLHVHI